MPTKKKNSRTLTESYKKQHGIHHKHGGNYLKVYWPYIPLVLFVITGIALSIIILSTKSANTGVTNISTATLLSSTNQARLSKHLGSLTINPQLSYAAQIKAESMVADNYWSPISPTGQTPWQIMQQTGYKYSIAGENLAYGFSNTKNLINAWLADPAHRANVLNSNYSNIGFGIAESTNFQNQGKQTIIVAIYASPAGTKTTSQSLSSTTSTPFTTASISAPHSVAISRIETLTNNYEINSIFISGAIIGVIACYLVIKHGLLLKKWALEGEKIVIKHPYMDVVLIIFIVGLASLNQTVGLIR